VGEATNTMGAMHGCGSVTLALMSAFPLVLAGNWPVVTLMTVALPPLMPWQLTMASKSGTGLVPREHVRDRRGQRLSRHERADGAEGWAQHLRASASSG
jgi:hypothetical protein